MNCRKSLLCKIETLRNKLNATVYKKGLLNEETIKISHQLDQLLNQYNQIKIGNK